MSLPLLLAGLLLPSAFNYCFISNFEVEHSGPAFLTPFLHVQHKQTQLRHLRASGPAAPGPTCGAGLCLPSCQGPQGTRGCSACNLSCLPACCTTTTPIPTQPPLLGLMLLGSQAPNLPQVGARLGELARGTIQARVPERGLLSVGISERGARLHQCICAGHRGCTAKQCSQRGVNPGSVFETCP